MNRVIISPRESWSTPASIGSMLTGPLDLVVVHHSYAPDVPAEASIKQETHAMRSMDRYHRETNGWAGIAYSFCLFQSGRVYEGRGWLRAGAHTEGHNHDAHGICFVIDGSRHAPTPVAWQAAKDLIREGIRIGAIAPVYRVEPHDRYKNKVCPGDRIKAILPQLLIRDQGIRDLKYGDRGEDVKVLQRRLLVKPASGTFGPITRAAVINFQIRNGLEPDGIVGPITRARLGL